MDELSQWCEIDGHEWMSYYVSYGLILGPKIQDVSRICRKCFKKEFMCYVPKDDDWKFYRIIHCGDII